jgi:hypothetical protein
MTVLNPEVVMSWDIVSLIWMAFGVIGAVKWCEALISSFKAASEKNKQKKGPLYSLLSLVLCGLAGYAMAGGDGWKALQYGFVLLALVELCYQLIIRTITKLIDKAFP